MDNKAQAENFSRKDEKIKEEIKKDLIPIQLGETQAKPFFCPAYEEVQKHFMKKPSLQMGGM